MNLNNGYGSGIGYKESSYDRKGYIIYNDVFKFRTPNYKIPDPRSLGLDYNLIFNLNEKI